MLIYRVKDWDQNFENNKSRERNECSFVCVPNKQDGMEFARIMAQPDGSAIYGIWNLILGTCSQQRKPRQGWLTQDGHSTGTAWAADDLALMFRRPVEEVSRAIEVLSSEKVRWLDVYQIEGNQPVLLGVRPVPATSPAGAPKPDKNIPPLPAECPPAARKLLAVPGKDQLILRYLNEKSGRTFREIDVNLKLIRARLLEVSGDVEGIKKMIDRQCQRWSGDPQMDEYLRPATLFNKTKFQSYYDLREVPTPKRKPEANQVQELIQIPQL